MDEIDKTEEERRIAEVMQIAESLAVGERQIGDIHDGYTRLGSATHGSFRFKWVAHEQEDGRYKVDETVGSSMVAVTSPPMPKSEVLPFIDERQRLHFQKIEDLRREWSAGQKPAPAPAPVEKPVPEPANAVERDPLEMYDEIRRMLKEQK